MNYIRNGALALTCVASLAAFSNGARAEAKVDCAYTGAQKAECNNPPKEIVQYCNGGGRGNTFASLCAAATKKYCNKMSNALEKLEQKNGNVANIDNFIDTNLTGPYVLHRNGGIIKSGKSVEASEKFTATIRAEKVFVKKNGVCKLKEIEYTLSYSPKGECGPQIPAPMYPPCVPDPILGEPPRWDQNEEVPTPIMPPTPFTPILGEPPRAN